MLLEDLHAHFGSYAEMTRQLQLGHTTYLGWVKKGYIPYSTQCVIESKTNRKFKAKPEHGRPKFTGIRQ